MKTFLEELLLFLSRNKEYPYYQAERRIDIFINFFLEDIYKAAFGKNIKYVAPEFPIKSENADAETKPYLNNNIDYVYFNKEDSKIIFVELKTENNSFNEDQLKRYVNAKWSQSYDFFKSILDYYEKKTSDRNHYLDKFKKLNTAINDAEIIPDKPYEIEVLYVLPQNSISKLERAIDSLMLSENERNRIKVIVLEKMKKLDIKTNYKEEWETINTKLFPN
jgi:hypothetical protein